MANIAVLVPRERMLEQVRQVVAEQDLPVHLMRQVETADTLDEARAAVDNGATILVARGLQANLIKEHTNIPLVEIKLTGQELGLLVMQAKQLADKECPAIALIGFKNMFSNTEHFAMLYGICLRVYCVERPDEIPQMVHAAHDDNVDVIIGGDSALRTAQQLAIPSLFYESTIESIREALDIAMRAGYASDMEKQRNAELESIMDTSFNGIARIGTDHTIRMVNLPMESMLGRPEGKLLGKVLEKEIRGIQHAFIETVLSGSREQNSTTIRVHNTMLMVIAAPVRVDGQITCAILNFHKMKTIVPRQTDPPKETLLHGYVTHADFSLIRRESPSVQQCMILAKKYALSKSPVVIYGAEGTETDVFAGSIHNNGVRKGQPFVSFDCAEAPAQEHLSILFGKEDEQYTGGARGLLHAASYGTLLLRNISQMNPVCQHRLAGFLLRGTFSGEDTLLADVRVIVTAQQHLSFALKEQRLCERLFYALGSLTLELPPLHETPDDITTLAAYFIKDYAESYSHFLVVPDKACRALQNYSWPGGIPQLRKFCEALVLTASKRHIDESYVEQQLRRVFPQVTEADGQYKIVVQQHPQAVQIEALLAKYNGHRIDVANALGISTTTLWRRMKKYGISPNR